MPLPATPSTERVWLNALRTYLTAETGITWENNPKPVVESEPVAGLWVMQDFNFERANVIGALTRDQMLGVVWQARGARDAVADLATDWKNYIVSEFDKIRRSGVVAGADSGAFRGIRPYQPAGQQTSSVFVQASFSSASGDTTTNTAVVDYKLEFRYVYKLPGSPSC